MPERDVIEILGGLSIEIVVSSQASNGTCCVFIETTPPGGGPPPHKHLREEEIFTVLEGNYELLADGVWTPMQVGRPVLSLRNSFHAFRNVGNTPGRMMAITNHGGIDDYFRALSRLTLPHDLERVTEISDYYGYVYLPPSEAPPGSGQ